MTWQLLHSSVSASAVGGSVATDDRFDPAFTSSVHTLSAFDKKLTNATGPYRTDQFGVYKGVLPAAMTDMVYWETKHEETTWVIDAFYALVTAAAKVRFNDNLTNAITYDNSFGYMGRGWIYFNNVHVSSGYPSIYNGDIAMFCYQPSTGYFWVGVNGLWDRIPPWSPPSYVLPTIEDRWPAYRPYQAGASIQLFTQSSELTYPLPIGAITLAMAVGAETQPAATTYVSVQEQSLYAVLGQAHPDKAAVFEQNLYVITT